MRLKHLGKECTLQLLAKGIYTGASYTLLYALLDKRTSQLGPKLSTNFA